MDILAPVAVLVFWTLVMLGWGALARFPAAAKAGLDIEAAQRVREFERKLQPEAQWKMDNHNNLMEQPTLFYAVALSLALLGAGDGLNLYLAWAYVGIRIVHSIVHATSNKVAIRFPLFSLSTFCLMIMVLGLLFAALTGQRVT